MGYYLWFIFSRQSASNKQTRGGLVAIKKALFLNKFYSLMKEKNIKTVDEIFNNLKWLYEEIKKETVLGVEEMTFQDFQNGAQQGFTKASMEQQMDQFMHGFKI
jgi:hypothetical protein